jgi:hypothetical protein
MGTRSIGNVYNLQLASLIGSSSGFGGSVKNNYSAIVDPNSNDDDSSGYSVGSSWVNLTNGKVFVCVNSTTTSAVWTETTGAGGSGTTTNPGGSNGAVQYNQNGTFGGQNLFYFWDSTNHRLGIGNNTPTTELDVTGSIGVSNNLLFGSSKNWRQRFDTSTGSLVFEFFNGSTWIKRFEIE